MQRKTNKVTQIFLIILALLLIGPIYALITGKARLDLRWQTAPHHSTKQAPDPKTTEEAVVQVYTARSFSWRGAFGVHSWIAAKPAGRSTYDRYECIGWLHYGGRSPISVSNNRYPPDGLWYGAYPTILKEYRGEVAAKIIDQLPQAVKTYPYQNHYQFWPGPNSNTFIAHLGREIPELKIDLPPTAIGKDYLGWKSFGRTPSRTGYQFSLFGLFGILIALEEGIEFNILSLTIGIDFKDLALKMPGIGQVGIISSDNAAKPPVE